MSAPTYRAGSRSDTAALRRLLAGLSPESAYSRFLTGIGAEPSAAILDALLPDGVRGGSVLAWDGDEPVGHGVWVRIGPSRSAELALLVADDHQRQGIGGALAERLLVEARAAGIEQIEVFTAAGNRGVARLVARNAPHAERERDGATVSYSFGLGAGVGVSAA